jgi:hypothetical protein
MLPRDVSRRDASAWTRNAFVQPIDNHLKYNDIEYSGSYFKSLNCMQTLSAKLVVPKLVAVLL